MWTSNPLSDRSDRRRLLQTSRSNGCKCSVREHRPIPCRAYDCRNDPRIWSDFANYVINPDLENLFRKRENLGPEPVES
jgi:hypothetical protein